MHECENVEIVRWRTYAVVDSLHDLSVEVATSIGGTDGDGLREVHAGEHLTGIGDVGNEERGTSVTNGRVR